MGKVYTVPLRSIPEELLRQVALSCENLARRHNTLHMDNHRQTCLSLMIEDLHVGLREDLHGGLLVGLCEGLHANHEDLRELVAQKDCGQDVGVETGLVYVHYSMDVMHSLVDLGSGGCRD